MARRRAARAWTARRRRPRRRCSLLSLRATRAAPRSTRHGRRRRPSGRVSEVGAHLQVAHRPRAASARHRGLHRRIRRKELVGIGDDVEHVRPHLRQALARVECAGGLQQHDQRMRIELARRGGGHRTAARRQFLAREAARLEHGTHAIGIHGRKAQLLERRHHRARRGTAAAIPCRIGAQCGLEHLEAAVLAGRHVRRRDDHANGIDPVRMVERPLQRLEATERGADHRAQSAP